jgi:hypothetical protein
MAVSLRGSWPASAIADDLDFSRRVIDINSSRFLCNYPQCGDLFVASGDGAIRRMRGILRISDIGNDGGKFTPDTTDNRLIPEVPDRRSHQRAQQHHLHHHIAHATVA